MQPFQYRPRKPTRTAIALLMAAAPVFTAAPTWALDRYEGMVLPLTGRCQD